MNFRPKKGEVSKVRTDFQVDEIRRYRHCPNSSPVSCIVDDKANVDDTADCSDE